MISDRLSETLPRPQRLALAYATARTRDKWRILLAFDARMGAIARSTSEPVIGQMRLAWWRDMLGRPAASRPIGEPLLAAIGDFGIDPEPLQTAIDGWERIIVADPISRDDVFALCQARAGLVSLLEPNSALRPELQVAAIEWALADLGEGSRDPELRGLARTATAEMPWQAVAMPRDLRPMAVLHALARRAVGRDGPAMLATPGDLLAAIRIGLLGR